MCYFILALPMALNSQSGRPVMDLLVVQFEKRLTQTARTQKWLQKRDHFQFALCFRCAMKSGGNH